MARPIIAVDIDDVLADNAAGFVAFSNERWGTHLTVDDYSEHWALLWQVDEAETEQRAQEFSRSGTVAAYHHDEMALAVLRRLKQRFELIVVTSRRVRLESETRAWLERYYSGIFTSINFAGIWDGPVTGREVYRTKATVCQALQANYLIDDQLKHCEAVAACGMQALLFGEYRWNRSDHLVQGVTRVADWRAVEAYFRDK